MVDELAVKPPLATEGALAANVEAEEEELMEKAVEALDVVAEI